MISHKRLLILIALVLSAVPSPARTPRQQRRANAHLIALWTDTRHAKTALMTCQAVEKALNQGTDINAGDRSGHTALIEAARYGDADLVSLLLRRGANVNARDSQGNTALMNAQPVRITALPKKGKEKTSFIIEISDSTGHAAVTKLLLDHGADVNAKNKAGQTALMMASSMGQADLVKLLKAAGAK